MQFKPFASKAAQKAVARSVRRSEIEEKRTEVANRVGAILGDSVICDRCGATYKTMNDVCSADLADPCPGFKHIDDVQVPIEAEVFGFNRKN